MTLAWSAWNFNFLKGWEWVCPVITWLCLSPTPHVCRYLLRNICLIIIFTVSTSNTHYECHQHSEPESMTTTNRLMIWLSCSILHQHVNHVLILLNQCTFYKNGHPAMVFFARQPGGFLSWICVLFSLNPKKGCQVPFLARPLGQIHLSSFLGCLLYTSDAADE